MRGTPVGVAAQGRPGSTVRNGGSRESWRKEIPGGESLRDGPGLPVGVATATLSQGHSLVHNVIQ